LGDIAENQLLQGALLGAFAEAGGQLEPASLEPLEITDAGVGVLTGRGRLAARVVVGADGAESRVREAAGIAADIAGYRQTAIIATVATSRPHEATAWQRFMRDGTLAFLPLADGTSSIVWSADDELAARLVAASEGAFTAELDRASDLALGATRLLGAAHHSRRGGWGRRAQNEHAWVNRSREMRRVFIRRALGTRGELPEAAH